MAQAEDVENHFPSEKNGEGQAILTRENENAKEQRTVFSAAQCLIRTDSEGQLEIDDNILQEIAALPAKKLVVIAIAGPYRTGKSYLMNRLAGKNAGFALGGTSEAKTKGIWVWITPHPKKKEEYIMLLDTEGLGDVQKDDNTHDCWLFCLATLLSSVLVFNNKGIITTDDLSKLDFIGAMAAHLQTGEERDSEVVSAFPDFIYVMRDCDLDLELNGKAVSEEDYFEHMLIERTGTDEKTTISNRKRANIRKYFTRRNCFQFPCPASRRKLKILEELKDSDIDEEFVTAVKSFCDHILENATIKKIPGNQKEGESDIAITGKRWTSLVETYVEAIRSGKVPTVHTAVDAMAKIENSKAVEDGFVAYKEQMSKIRLSGRNEKTYDDENMKAKDMALALFNAQALWDKNDVYRTMLEERIQRVYEELKQGQKDNSRGRCNVILSEMEKNILHKLGNGTYTRIGGFADYSSDMNRLKEDYEKKTTDEIMYDEALVAFCEKKKEVGQNISETEEEIQNRNESRQHCQTVIDEWKQLIQLKIANGSYKKIGGLKEYETNFNRAKDDYKQNTANELMSQEVLDDFCKEQEGVGKNIFNAEEEVKKREDSRAKCQPVIDEWKQRIQQKVANGNYKKIGGFKEYETDINKAKDEYEQKTSDELMSKEVLDDFCREQEEVGSNIMNAEEEVKKQNESKKRCEDVLNTLKKTIDNKLENDTYKKVGGLGDYEADLKQTKRDYYNRTLKEIMSQAALDDFCAKQVAVKEKVSVLADSEASEEKCNKILKSLAQSFIKAEEIYKKKGGRASYDIDRRKVWKEFEGRTKGEIMAKKVYDAFCQTQDDIEKSIQQAERDLQEREASEHKCNSIISQMKTDIDKNEKKGTYKHIGGHLQYTEDMKSVKTEYTMQTSHEIMGKEVFHALCAQLDDIDRRMKVEEESLKANLNAKLQELEIPIQRNIEDDNYSKPKELTKGLSEFDRHVDGVLKKYNEHKGTTSDGEILSNWRTKMNGVRITIKQKNDRLATLSAKLQELERSIQTKIRDEKYSKPYQLVEGLTEFDRNTYDIKVEYETLKGADSDGGILVDWQNTLFDMRRTIQRNNERKSKERLYELDTSIKRKINLHKYSKASGLDEFERDKRTIKTQWEDYVGPNHSQFAGIVQVWEGEKRFEKGNIKQENDKLQAAERTRLNSNTANSGDVVRDASFVNNWLHDRYTSNYGSVSELDVCLGQQDMAKDWIFGDYREHTFNYSCSSGISAAGCSCNWGDGTGASVVAVHYGTERMSIGMKVKGQTSRGFNSRAVAYGSP